MQDTDFLCTGSHTVRLRKDATVPVPAPILEVIIEVYHTDCILVQRDEQYGEQFLQCYPVKQEHGIAARSETIRSIQRGRLNLRQYVAHFPRGEVCVFSMVDHVELWDQQTYDRWYDKSRNSSDQQAFLEAVRDLGL